MKSEESRIREDCGDKNKKAMTFTGDRSLLYISANILLGFLHSAGVCADTFSNGQDCDMKSVLPPFRISFIRRISLTLQPYGEYL